MEKRLYASSKDDGAGALDNGNFLFKLDYNPTDIAQSVVDLEFPYPPQLEAAFDYYESVPHIDSTVR